MASLHPAPLLILNPQSLEALAPSRIAFLHKRKCGCSSRVLNGLVLDSHVTKSHKLLRTLRVVQCEAEDATARFQGAERCAPVTNSEPVNTELKATRPKTQKQKKPARSNVVTDAVQNEPRTNDQNMQDPSDGRDDAGFGFTEDPWVEDQAEDPQGNAAERRLPESDYSGIKKLTTHDYEIRSDNGAASTSSVVIEGGEEEHPGFQGQTCLVKFRLEVQTANTERPNLIGNVKMLGAWDPLSAIPLIQAPGEDGDVWQMDLQVPYGKLLEYNYFIRTGEADLTWKSEPARKILLPAQGQSECPFVTIKDCWTRASQEYAEKNGNLLIDPDVMQGELHDLDRKWGEEDPFLAIMQLEQSTTICSVYREKKMSGAEDPFLALMEFEERNEAGSSQVSPVRPRWPEFRFFPRRKVFPREEPWLLESIFLSESKEASGHEASGPKEEHDVAVEIFINSSECTMQRIAIVENKKLVQLLLEPVNSNFQVGNVYLGVVKQLLPGMNGIFADIGSSRTALLEVNMHHFPHVFPHHEADRTGSDYGTLAAKNIRNENVIDVNGEGSTDHSDECNGDGGFQENGDVNEAGSSADANSSKPATLLQKIAAWRKVRKGDMMIVQVKKEALRQKGPQLTATVGLAGRFWVLVPQTPTIGVTRKITGLERSRLKQLARDLQPSGFGLTVRSEAVGRTREELEKDLARLMESWKEILERAEVAAAAGGKDPVPVLLQRAMGQTLRIVRDVFNDEVERFVVDSAQTYQEVTGYLQEVAPHLCDRVELYGGKQPIFDAFNLEAEIEKSSSKRVELPNGAYLVLEETEALVSIDVNGGVGMLGDATSQKDAVLEVNLAAARQIATELRLRDIGGIIVVDFIDMEDSGHEKLVIEEMCKSIERDRSKVAISDISEFGLMEMTRARDRPSVTSRITDVCLCCAGYGRVESLETTLSKIERAIKRVLGNRENIVGGTKWPAMALQVDPVMFDYLKSRGRRRVNQLCSALNVLLTLKVASDFSRGQFQVFDHTKDQIIKRHPSIISSRLLGKRARLSNR